MSVTPRKWRWTGGGEVNWRCVGLGAEVSFGDWLPPEWSIHLHIGPVLLWAGIEEDYGDDI